MGTYEEHAGCDSCIMSNASSFWESSIKSFFLIKHVVDNLSLIISLFLGNTYNGIQGSAISVLHSLAISLLCLTIGGFQLNCESPSY